MEGTNPIGNVNHNQPVQRKVKTAADYPDQVVTEIAIQKVENGDIEYSLILDGRKPIEVKEPIGIFFNRQTHSTRKWPTGKPGAADAYFLDTDTTKLSYPNAKNNNGTLEHDLYDLINRRRETLIGFLGLDDQLNVQPPANNNNNQANLDDANLLQIEVNNANPDDNNQANLDVETQNNNVAPPVPDPVQIVVADIQDDVNANGVQNNDDVNDLNVDNVEQINVDNLEQINNVPPQLTLIQDLDVAVVPVKNGEFKIQYSTRVNGPGQPFQDVEDSLDDFLGWLTGDGSTLANIGFGLEQNGINISVNHNGTIQTLKQVTPTRQDILNLLNIQACDTLTAKRDGEIIHLYIAGDRLSFDAAGYAAWIDGLNAKPYYVSTNGNYYSISKETKVKGFGDQGEGQPLSATTWEQLRNAAIPIRITKATIKIQKDETGRDWIALQWKYNGVTESVKIDYVTEWNNVISAIQNGIKLKDGAFFFDGTLEVTWGGQQVSLADIELVQRASELNPLSFKQVTLLRVSDDHQTATILADGVELEISVDTLRKRRIDLNGVWYSLPAPHEFRLGPSQVHLLLDAKELANEPLSRFVELLAVETQGQPGAILRRDGEYRFVQEANAPNIVEISQSGKIKLTVALPNGQNRELQFNYSDYQALCHAATPGKGVLAGITNLFLPEAVLAKIDAHLHSWGSDPAHLRVLSKIVVHSQKTAQGMIEVEAFSGDLSWGVCRFNSNELSALLKAVNTADEVKRIFRSKLQDGTFRYFSIPDSGNPQLIFIDEDGKEKAKPWPTGNYQKADLFIDTYTTDRGDSRHHPLAISQVIFEADGSFTLNGWGDENRGTKDHRLVELAVGQAKNNAEFRRIVQYSVVGEAYRPGKKWVTFDAQTQVTLADGTSESLDKYISAHFPPTTAIAHPVLGGKLVLDCGAQGQVTLEGEELELFRQADKLHCSTFPLATESSTWSIIMSDLKSVIGTDVDHPRQVRSIIFTLPKDNEEKINGSLRFENQEPFRENGDRLGSTSSGLDFPIQWLANYLDGQEVQFPPMDEGAKGQKTKAFYELANSCSVTIRSSDGTVLVTDLDVKWNNAGQRQQLADVIRRAPTTTVYSGAQTVCVRKQEDGRLTLQIDGTQRELDQGQTNAFVNAMDRVRPYTLPVHNRRPITIAPAALYPLLGTQEKPFQITSMRLESTDRGLQLTYSHQAVAIPYKPLETVNRAFTDTATVTQTIQKLTAAFPGPFNGTDRAWYAIADGCTIAYNGQVHVFTADDARRTLINTLQRDLTIHPTGEVFVDAREYGDTGVWVNIRHGNAVYKTEVPLTTYKEMAVELNAGRSYTIEANGHPFTFDRSKLKGQVKALPANDRELKSQKAIAVTRAVFNSDVGTLNLVTDSGTVYHAPFDQAKITGIQNGDASAIELFEADGVVLSVKKGALVDQTPKPVTPDKVVEVDALGYLRVRHEGVVYNLNRTYGSFTTPVIERVAGMKFLIEPAKVERYVAPAPRVASSSRPIILWSSGAVVSLLAGFGLYKWARKNPAFGEWVTAHTPNWVKSRLGA